MSKASLSVPVRRRRLVKSDGLPMWGIGFASGLVGILCCVGPTVLVVFGIISAGTAFVWANDLYDNYAWWFRLGGVAVLGLLVWVSLRRRNQCSLAGVRQRRWRLLGVLAVALLVRGKLLLTLRYHIRKLPNEEMLACSRSRTPSSRSVRRSGGGRAESTAPAIRPSSSRLAVSKSVCSRCQHAARR